MDVLWPVLLETWIHFRGWSKAGVGRYPCFMQCGNSGDVPPGVLAPGSKRKRGKALTVELPKTLAIEVRQLLEVGARNITAPVAHDLGHDRRQAREDAAMEAWKQLLLSSGAVGPLSSSRPDSLAFVEISFSEHEDTQLRFGRKAAASGKAIPPCLFGAECQAFRVRGVIQPLQVYLTPSEQRAVDAAADPQFPSDGACLLCTRHTHQVCAPTHFWLCAAAADILVLRRPCTPSTGRWC